MDERSLERAAIAHWWRRIQDATSGMRRAWATSRASKPALLELLCSVDDDEIVRLAVASPNLDSGALDRLAGHSSAIVRRGIEITSPPPMQGPVRFQLTQYRASALSRRGRDGCLGVETLTHCQGRSSKVRSTKFARVSGLAGSRAI